MKAGMSPPCNSNIHHGSFIGTANGVHGTTPVVNGVVHATYLRGGRLSWASHAGGAFITLRSGWRSPSDSYCRHLNTV